MENKMHSFLIVISLLLGLAYIAPGDVGAFSITSNLPVLSEPEQIATSCGDTITGNLVLANDLLNCPGNGIIFGASSITLDCNGHKISGSSDWYGISAMGKQDITVRNCTIQNFSEGIYLDSTNNSHLIDNNANLNINRGIWLESSNSNILTNNNASNNTEDNRFSNNEANMKTIGIRLENSNTNILPGIGILLRYSTNNILTGNTVTSNGQEGIRLWESSNNTISNSSANSNNEIGIMLIYNSNNNTFTNNTASNNAWPNVGGGYGIYTYFSNRNVFSGNMISSSNYSTPNSGICFDMSNDNLIYNNFFNNTINAVDNSVNFWNITKTAGTNIVGGSFLGGNYWSDYTGNDTDGDGIGDTNLPYNSNGNIVSGGDFAPLVGLIDSDSPAITLISPANNTIINNTSNIAFSYSVSDPTSGVASCSLFVDGALVQNVTPITEGIPRAFTQTILNGQHAWKISCMDNSPQNNVGNSETRSIKVQYTPPNNSGCYYYKLLNRYICN